MHRMVAGILHFAQHISSLASDSDRYRPARCPRCGLACLWRHGSYLRKTDHVSQDNLTPWVAEKVARIIIPRFICADCGKTCSRLPEFLSPRRWHDWIRQAHVLLGLLEGLSVRCCSRRHGVARSTVRRWRTWMYHQTCTFRFHLCSRYPELGRTVDSTAFWNSCLRDLTLSTVMVYLNTLFDVP